MPAQPNKAETLEICAVAALAEPSLKRKMAMTERLADAWDGRRLSRFDHRRPGLPTRPGRPDRPELLPPQQVPKRGIGSPAGRLALIHAICHIELNAVDLALDIIARFARVDLPRSFFDDWIRVAREEAKHFGLLNRRMDALGSAYGDLPAHDGLWDSARATADNITARLALVPLVLEARGLDVTPGLSQSLRDAGDHSTAEIFDIIYEDEKGHVAVGAKWFRFLCRRQGLDPSVYFQQVVRERFRGPLRPPFNDRARCASGITPNFYRNLSSLGH